MLYVNFLIARLKVTVANPHQRSFELDAPKLARYVTYTLLSAPPNLYWQSWLESTFPRYTNADVSGTTTQLANDPNVKSATEAVAPAVDLVKDKTNSVSTAIAHDPNVQTLSRRVTAGVDRVKAQARAIKERYGSAPAASSMQKAVTRSDTAQAATDTLSSLQSGEKDALLDRNHAAAKEQKLNIKNTAIKFAFDQTFGAVINNLLFIIGINLLQGMSWEYIRADIQQVLDPPLCDPFMPGADHR